MNKEEIYRELFGGHDKPYMGVREDENIIDFYRRSGLVAVEKARQFLSEQLSTIEVKYIEEYIRRIQSGGLIQSFFELLVKSLFVREHYTVIMHDSYDRNLTPDLYLKEINCYVECLCIFDPERKQRNAKQLRRVEKYLNKHLIKDKYNLLISLIESLPTENDKIICIDEINEWIQSELETPTKLRKKINSNGLVCELVLIERESICSTPVVGNVTYEMIDYQVPHIRHKLIEKARKYKNIGSPFIIAFNNLLFYSNRERTEGILFGEIKDYVSISPVDFQPTHSRERRSDGFIFENSKPRYKRVSAVFSFTKAYPSSFFDSDPILYLNPFSYHQVDRAYHFTLAHVEDNKVNYKEGKPLHEILDMPPNWPND